VLHRLIRTTLSLLLLLAAYGLYSRLVVPWIEPAARRPQGRASTEAERAAARNAVRAAREELSAWFAPGDWELHSSKILETPQGKLLLEQYQNLGQGQIRVRPCTMVLWPQGQFEDERERQRRAIVVQAPAGAILQFDSEFDLKQGRVGKLVGGKLVGRVILRSDCKHPGPADDLWVTARELYLTEERLTSAHEVRFRLGENRGQGRELIVRLARTSGAGDQPASGAVRTVELLQDVRLELQQTGAGLFAGLSPLGKVPGSPRMAAAPAGSQLPPRAPAADVLPQPPTPAADATARPGPVEVACDGPFRFDLEQQVATFERRVTVRRRLPQMAPDALDCELLAIHFRREPALSGQQEGAATDASGPRGASDPTDAGAGRLVPTRIVATGDPVVVESPLYGVSARASRVEYDLQSGMVRLHDRKQALLRRLDAVTGEQREIRCLRLEYTPDPQGGWGTLLAEGPGWMRGWLPTENPAQAAGASGEVQRAASAAALSDAQTDVSWERHLHFRLHDGLRVLSLMGPARMALPGQGSLAAAEIHVWLSEDQDPPPPAGSPGRLIPERLLARGNVEIDSPQFLGSVSDLQVWFERPPSVPSSQPGAHAPGAASPVTAGEEPATALPEAAALPAGAHHDAGPRLFPAGGDSEQQAGSYDISAQLLQVRLLLREGQALVPVELRAQGAVRLRELAGDGGRAPLGLDGDLMHVLQQNGVLTLTAAGAPSTLFGPGVTLVGEQIVVEQAAELRVTIDGAGQMQIDAPPASVGQAPGWQADAGPDRLLIRWDRAFQLRGRTARFTGSVAASRAHEELKTNELLVEFTAPLRLDLHDDRRPGLARLTCPGQAHLKRRSLQLGQTRSLDRLLVKDLRWDMQTGRLWCQGPGWLRTTSMGSSVLPPPGETAPQPAAPPSGGVAGPAQDAAAMVRQGALLMASGGRAAEGTPAAALLGPAEADAGGSSGLTFLGVEFQQSLEGNLQQRELAFVGGVRAVYGRVSRWDEELPADEPDLRGTEGFALQCERLLAAQMGQLADGGPAYDLEASGTTIVEGADFTAQAHRMSYSQSKDLLLLEGGGRDDARLLRRAADGSRLGETQARRIYYWRSRNRVRVEDIRGFDVNDLGLRQRH